MNPLEFSLLVLYFAVMTMLALFGLHRLSLVVRYYLRRRVSRQPPLTDSLVPAVTVQLPIYNERFVATRLIDAVAALDYPRDRLQIQVLDDSQDDTVLQIEKRVAYWRQQGLDIHHIRRRDRIGYKAGALEHGLASASGQLIAIFDADFVPEADFLRRCVPAFADPGVGMVQARWEHLNRGQSLLTAVQAMMLDGHFLVEHEARQAGQLFFNFNGTAGVFRKQCIVDAGGWQHDTLTEDLDLSYRAQLAGWRFIFLSDVVAPAELPGFLTSFKAQQFRWAKGSIQTACKLGSTIAHSSLRWPVKLEALLHLHNNVAYALLAILALILPAVVECRQGHGLDVTLLLDAPLFIFASGSVGLFFLTGEQAAGRSLTRSLLLLPLLFAVGVGMCVNNTRAVISALLGVQSPFLRTPKHASQSSRTGLQQATQHGYRSRIDWTLVVELGFAVYYAGALIAAIQRQHYYSLPWLVLFFSGFSLVGGASLLEGLQMAIHLRQHSVRAGKCGTFY